MTQEEYMQIALEEARKGCGFVNPNPMVGAVIVLNDRIISKSYHKKYGEFHAERNAIMECKESMQGATIYVTLEPCCHYGKTPPCTEAIIESGITKVVIGSRDPNPLVAGEGVRQLREHGILVVEDVCLEECDELNAVFFHYIKNKTPFVVMKYAMTMDGKIATSQGLSKWITGEKAREQVHKDRMRYAGIMVGIHTVIQDDPMLDCRIEGGRNPIRIICDTNLRMPLSSKIVTTAKQISTYLATACTDKQKQQPFLDAGCHILELSKKGEHIDLTELMIKLGEQKIDSVYLEGGATLNYAALEERLVNRVHTYIAPKIFGGEMAKTPVAGVGVMAPADAFTLKQKKMRLFGEDIWIESEVDYHIYGNC